MSRFMFLLVVAVLAVGTESAESACEDLGFLAGLTCEVCDKLHDVCANSLVNLSSGHTQ